MKIRKARKGDIDRVLELYLDFLNYTNKFGRWIYKKRPKVDEKELKIAIRKRIKPLTKRIFLVAEDNSKLVGFISAEIISPRESKTNKKVIEVVDIYSKNKRKGIGKKLFKEVEEWAKSNKANFIQWEFIQGNKLAEKFCINNKFRHFKIKMLKKLK